CYVFDNQPVSNAQEPATDDPATNRTVGYPFNFANITQSEIVNTLKSIDSKTAAASSLLPLSLKFFIYHCQDLQLAFDDIQKQLFHMKLVLNSRKTQYMVLSNLKADKWSHLQILTLNDHLIERISRHLFLGQGLKWGNNPSPVMLLGPGTNYKIL
ncbi:unnamed protein product, partial [Coregonus sp. 'balchen']